MNGFFIIDKPAGITSFDVIRRMRKILGLKKMGHLGTLDPFATGVLVVGINKATKLIHLLMGEDKTYTAEITLGAITDTYDIEGQKTFVSDKKVSISEIKDALKHFKGVIKQTPPIFSALKINGKRSYELARKGIKPEIKGREIKIGKIQIISFYYPKIKLLIECSTGTYIRSIACDLGNYLGVGGYLSSLRREKVGDFDINNSVKLEDLKLNDILLLDDINFKYKSINIKDPEKFLNGNSLKINTLGNCYPVLVYNNKKIIGIAEIRDRYIYPKKVL